MMGEITWKETRFLSVPLTDEEIQSRGEQLADLVKERDDLEASQAEQKKQMKDALATVEGRIRHLAGVVTSRVEERSVQVEVRYNPNLNLIEEVRTDTGEIVKTRTPTTDDKVRASQQSQTTIPGTEPPQS